MHHCQSLTGPCSHLRISLDYRVDAQRPTQSLVTCVAARTFRIAVMCARRSFISDCIDSISFLCSFSCRQHVVTNVQTKTLEPRLGSAHRVTVTACALPSQRASDSHTPCVGVGRRKGPFLLSCTSRPTSGLWPLRPAACAAACRFQL